MKKQSIFIGLLAVLLFIGQSAISQTISYQDSWSKQGFSLQEESSSHVIINYSLTDFALIDVNIDGEIAKAIKVPGIFLPNDEGAPDLPGTGKYIAIPQGAEAVLNIKALRTEVIKNVNVAPAMAIPLDGDQSPIKYEKDQKIYSSNQFYPAEAVMLSENLKIRGVDVVMLGITPFQYNPVTKELIVYRDLQIEVSFKGGNGHFGEDRLRSRWWDPILHTSVINFSTLPEMNYTHEASVSETPDYEYIIITPDIPDFISWADTIKDFRTRQGIKTGIVTTTEIGGNTVDNIEAYIDNAYNTWDIPPSAVLLLGDYSTGSDGIISHLYDHYSYSYPDYASDNRYADVDGNDLPEVILARITARNAAELEVMIKKFIDYETNPPTAADFYDHPITALGWQTERWFQICSETIGGYFKNVQGKNPVRINALYSGNPSSDPWSSASNTSTVVDYFGPDGLGYIPGTPQETGGFTGGTGTDVINAINAGSLLLQHRDHGGYTGWGEPAFNTTSINSLTNVNNKLPYIFSINCQTGAFHRSTECFAEKFHRYTYNGQNSGALGILAATEVSYSFVNDTYVWGVFDNMFPDFMPDETTHFPVSFVMPAFANAGGKYYLSQSTWTSVTVKQITYRLFHHHGDAYLTLYTEVPQNLSVTHASSILNTETSFNVTADAESFIALAANGEILGTADGTGSPVSITIPAQSLGTVMTVTVTKQNFYRYESDVTVTAGGILAEFSANNTTLCEGETVTFTDQSSGSITSWSWDFNGGTPAIYSGETPPAIAYNTAGTYDVTLTIGDGSNNDTETKTGYITVEALTADFSGTPTTITFGNAVTFTDNSSCNPTSWSWSFPGGTPNSYNDQNPPAITYNSVGAFDVILTVSNASGNDTKTLLDYVTVTDIQYCTSHGDASIEWVASVNFGEQTNTSGSSGSAGYEDFTGFNFNMNSGSSNAIVLSPGFAGRSSHQYWKVWIDYNHDGDFTDANEEVFAPSKSKTAVSGSIAIPSGLNVTTLMRVSMKSGGYATSCEVFSRGEVEDYTITISEPTPQAPVANFTSDKTIIGINESVQFTDQSLNDPTSWSWTFEGGTPLTSTDQNPSVTYDGLGTFDVSLIATNAQGSDQIIKYDYITVSDNPVPPYCIPIVSNASDYINSITIGTTTHSSGQGASGYLYYTSPSFIFTPGTPYDITLVPFNAKNRNFWRIWVDFNNDGDFDDADETIFVANNKKGTVSGTINIPGGVGLVEPDRMRITMKTGGAPSPCEENFNGEVEDYDVTYNPEGDLFIRPALDKLYIGVYPNPANNLLNINISGNYGKVSVYIYNAVGNLMHSFMMDDQTEQISLDHYSQGMYFIHVYDGRERSLQKFIKR